MSEAKSRLVIFGCGELAEVAHYYFSTDSKYTVEGFVVDEEFQNVGNFCGLPVEKSSDCKSSFPPDKFQMFIAVGYTKMNEVRERKYEWSRGSGYELASYVSSRASIARGVKLGDNCFVLENNVLQPFVSLGNDVFLWSGNHVGHHSSIKDHVFVSSHCVISGKCIVGERSFLGVNCTIQDEVHVGARSFVGPRALVRANTPDDCVLIESATQQLRVKSGSLIL
jgi:sugar O-acyltransferase (sialic acid O-acetyltransferase NeuD family)